MSSNTLVKGVSPDAEIVENEKGGRQSSTCYSCNLLDPEFVLEFYQEPYVEQACDHSVTAHPEIRKAVKFIAEFMRTQNKSNLISAALATGMSRETILLNISEILKYGCARYGANNWRNIPQEDHINHALIHAFAFLSDDQQDDHLNHMLCRLMFAWSTETTDNKTYYDITDSKGHLVNK